MFRRSPSPSIAHDFINPHRGRRSSYSLSSYRGSPSLHSDYPLPGGTHYGSHISSSPMDIGLLIREAYDIPRHRVSRRKSESWHRRIYGGRYSPARTRATHIGAAAGYEAWRQHNYRHGIILDGDQEWQIRALVEAAVYEVDRWWDDAGRHGDTHGKREALLAAAAIAIKLFRKGDYGHSRHKSRRSRSRLGHRHGYSSGSSLSSISSYSSDGRYRHGGVGSVIGDYLRGRPRSRSEYGGLSKYGDYGDEYYRGRSPYGRSHHLGSGLLSTALGTSGYRHHRHRAYSPSGRHSPPLEGLMSGLSLGSGYDYDYPRRDHAYYGGDYGYGRHHSQHHHGGTSVIRATSGDPTSEFGHLRPGTYIMEGGSRRYY
ncbi:hypothetical protein RhiJN_26390 [Ceratobasidium sp. AG-Ba]|nr:hypothetical protein RhiJN_26390 [Ceratobasidium sp. AG-Ba]